MGEKQGHTAAKFRDDLMKIMPGYQWTVRRPTVKDGSYLEATGIQSSGFNRLSTLSVIRTDRAGVVAYEAKSAGFGTRAKWLHRNSDGTLARALRGLQDHYEAVSNTYRAHAVSLKNGRIEPAKQGPVAVTIACPKCATPHIDQGEWATTRHHKTHQCQSCGHEWRPFPFATVGIPHPIRATGEDSPANEGEGR